MRKIKIIEAGNELGLGGTEYVMQLYCKYLNKDIFDVTALAIHEGGARVELIEGMGIQVVILHGNMDHLAEILHDVDVFHWHCDGYINSLVFGVIQKNKPTIVIQTNVFGNFDNSPLYSLIDYDLYISNMILIRRMYIDSLHPELIPPHLYISKRKVLANPVDVDHLVSILPSDEELENFKNLNNLKNLFIIGRIGRADNSKFDLITLDGFAEFANEVENARFLLVGATPEIISYAIELGIYDRLILFETTNDLKKLMLYYKSLDVFLAASAIGESFGMVIAEAMTVGVPVITISTEDRDNAQIEMVDNNETGLVVERNANTIVEAIFNLYQNENIRTKLSASSRNKILKEYRAINIVKSLEYLIFDHLKSSLPQSEKSLIKDFSLYMVKEYIYRCSDLWS